MRDEGADRVVGRVATFFGLAKPYRRFRCWGTQAGGRQCYTLIQEPAPSPYCDTHRNQHRPGPPPPEFCQCGLCQCGKLAGHRSECNPYGLAAVVGEER